MNGYAPVNGLELYYEIHGESHGESHGGGRPLVLLHGALSGIGTSFGQILPLLARQHRVIAVEWQGHGRTADIDRPLTFPQLADDTIALLRHLGVESADLFGYSFGAAIAFEVALRAPALVGKLVLASFSHDPAGLQPGVLEGIEALTPELTVGSPFEEEYLRAAPDPEHWPALLEKIKAANRDFPSWPADVVRSVTAPTLLVIGDTDVVTPSHAAETFGLFASARLAILPGTSHTDVPARADLLAPMIEAFLGD